MDEIVKEQDQKQNLGKEEISLVLKVPANREDLRLETFLVQEMNLLFLIEVYDIWKKIQKKLPFTQGCSSAKAKNNKQVWTRDL